MKKLFFFAAFLCAASLTTVNAQCTKSASTKTACCAKTKAATAKAVASDSSIEKRVCKTSGKETYYRNAKCPMSGKIESTQVEFDAKQGVFVNVSPTRGDMPAADSTKKACSSAEKAACAKKCSKAEKAACGVKATKQANAEMKADAPARATLTKGESN